MIFRPPETHATQGLTAITFVHTSIFYLEIKAYPEVGRWLITAQPGVTRTLKGAESKVINICAYYFFQSSETHETQGLTAITFVHTSIFYLEIKAYPEVGRWLITRQPRVTRIPKGTEWKVISICVDYDFSISWNPRDTRTYSYYFRIYFDFLPGNKSLSRSR